MITLDGDGGVIAAWTAMIIHLDGDGGVLAALSVEVEF